MSLIDIVLFKQLLHVKIGRDAILLTLLAISFLDKTVFEMSRIMVGAMIFFSVLSLPQEKTSSFFYVSFC